MKKLIYLQAMLCIMFANSLSVLGQNITKQAEAKQGTGDRLMSRNMLHIIAFRDTDLSLSQGKRSKRCFWLFDCQGNRRFPLPFGKRHQTC